jgi:hypothetical protein
MREAAVMIVDKSVPPWPQKTYIDDPDYFRLDYERALRIAWEARARLAVEALNIATQVIGCGCACIRCKTASDRAHEALNAIGELPQP